MFRKLRLQLVIINVVIITMLFTALTAGAYFFVRNDMVKRWTMLLERPPKPPTELQKEQEGAPLPPPKLPLNFEKGRLPPPPQEFRDRFTLKDELPKEMMDKNSPFPMHFYGKTDEAGKLVVISENSPLAMEDMKKAVEQVLGLSEAGGIIEIADSNYLYLKRPLNTQEGMYIIFRSFSHEESILRVLVLILSVVGCVCIVLSFIGTLILSKKALEPVQEAWQQQKDFLADVSHELRTPLAVIQTNLELVEDNETETVKSQEKWLTNIKEETAYMTQMVASLLFLARADAHQQFMTIKEFSLDEAVFMTTEQFQPMARQRKITLVAELIDSVDFSGDEMRIKQVLGILLDNGLRHTPQGGSIRVKLEKNSQEIVLKVMDTGEGIAAEHLEKIFERFYQVDKARRKGGAGLGLSIAKWIVENHQGSMGVKSQVGQGTTFIMRFPCQVG